MAGACRNPLATTTWRAYVLLANRAQPGVVSDDSNKKGGAITHTPMHVCVDADPRINACS
jgi:hypothetical protein